MKKFSLIVLFLLVTHVFAADDRTQLPVIFQNSYLGFNLGYSNFNFSNNDLAPGFQAQQINNNGVMVRVFAGHYFNPYLAMQVTYMRPVEWVAVNNLSYQTTPIASGTVWLNYFILSLKPTLPLNDRWSIYGEVGPAYVSRYGINTPQGTAVSTTQLVVPMTGVGASYRFGENWHADMSVNSLWANAANNQPATMYAMAGLYYLFDPEQAVQPSASSAAVFPEQVVSIGGFDRSFLNLDATPVFTSIVPIFWQGDIQTQSGGYLMYEKNVYHSARWVSLDWGLNLARWTSQQDHNVFYTASIFPALRIWLIKQPVADLYFIYSVAGPSYISTRNIDNQDEGQHFTFEDFLGFGTFLGHSKHFNMELKIIHYSSGNLMPPANPGIKIPVTFSLGYAF